MNIAVRYFTRSGNTKKLALVIAETAGVKAQDVSVPLSEHTDILFLGSSVYAAGVDEAVKKFLADNHDKIGTIYNFSTAAIISSTYGQIKKLCAEHGIKLAEEEFHCRGSFTVMHKNHPDAADTERAAVFAKRVLENNR